MKIQDQITQKKYSIEIEKQKLQFLKNPKYSNEYKIAALQIVDELKRYTPGTNSSAIENRLYQALGGRSEKEANTKLLSSMLSNVVDSFICNKLSLTEILSGKYVLQYTPNLYNIAFPGNHIERSTVIAKNRIFKYELQLKLLHKINSELSDEQKGHVNALIDFAFNCKVDNEGFNKNLINKGTYKDEMDVNRQHVSEYIKDETLLNEIVAIAQKCSGDDLGFLQKMWDKITEWLSYIGINIEKGVSGTALLERKCGSFVDNLIKSQQTVANESICY